MLDCQHVYHHRHLLWRWVLWSRAANMWRMWLLSVTVQCGRCDGCLCFCQSWQMWRLSLPLSGPPSGPGVGVILQTDSFRIQSLEISHEFEKDCSVFSVPPGCVCSNCKPAVRREFECRRRTCAQVNHLLISLLTRSCLKQADTVTPGCRGETNWLPFLSHPLSWACVRARGKKIHFPCLSKITSPGRSRGRSERLNGLCAGSCFIRL